MGHEQVWTNNYVEDSLVQSQGPAAPGVTGETQCSTGHTQQQQLQQQHCTCCSPRASNPHSFNTLHPSQFLPLSSFHCAQWGWAFLWPFYEQFDLLLSVGVSSCGQGQATGKSSFEQNVWRVLGWSGGRLLWVGGVGGAENFLNVIDEVSHMEERRQEKQQSQGTLAGYWPSRWPPSHVLSAEGCLCQQHCPSYWLQQLSNICSLALTNEKEPVKIRQEWTTRYVTLLIMRSWCSIDQREVRHLCFQPLLHVFCMLGNTGRSHEWDKGICFGCHAPSMYKRCFSSLACFEVLFVCLFFLRQPLCVRRMATKHQHKRTTHSRLCHNTFWQQNQLD